MKRSKTSKFIMSILVTTMITYPLSMNINTHAADNTSMSIVEISKFNKDIIESKFKKADLTSKSSSQTTTTLTNTTTSTTTTVTTTTTTTKTKSDIGLEGYKHYNTGKYQCVSIIGTSLKEKPNVKDSKIVYNIAENEYIDFIKTNGRWGYAEVTTSNGNTYKGWTNLDNFIQIYDEPQPYITTTDTYIYVAPWTGSTEYMKIMPEDHNVKLEQIFQNHWALINTKINNEYNEPEYFSGWVDINNITFNENYIEEEEETEWYYINPNYENGSNWDIIYRYLRNELGFNSAVSQGILTNIGYESSWNPNAWCIDTNGLISYGICQWNGGRYSALQDYCKNNHLDYTSLYGQLEYLQYELLSSYYGHYLTLFYYNDDENGCKDAAYYWASKFEVCSSKYWMSRANSAYYDYDAYLE